MYDKRSVLLSAVKTWLQSYSNISYSMGGVTQMWILKKSKNHTMRLVFLIKNGTGFVSVMMFKILTTHNNVP
jgi:hypothetical protein